MHTTYRLEELDSQDRGPCECCGNMSRMVSGLIYLHGEARAGFQVHWTPGHVAEHGAGFYFIVGRWGKTAAAMDRVGVALRYGETQSGFAFTVVNAADTPLAGNELAERLLSRDEVIGTPLAQEVFDMVDFIWLTDSRIMDITGLDREEVCENCAAEDAEEAVYFEIPGFGDGQQSPEAAAVTPRIVVIGVWMLGCLFLFASVAVLFTDSETRWEIKCISALVALASVLAITRFTRFYVAEKKARKKAQ
jgi:hypothetical protein